MASALKERYDKTIKDELRKRFGYDNVMRIPCVEKVVVNIGMGEAIGNAKAMDAAAGDLATITGQRPVVTRSKKAISNFRLRIGMPIGLKVTLRGERMWHFLEKLIHVAFPRVRDFRGIPESAVDSTGNFHYGFTEHTVFPEIGSKEIESIHGLQISVTSTAKTHDEGIKLFRALGFPFKNDEDTK